MNCNLYSIKRNNCKAGAFLSWNKTWLNILMPVITIIFKLWCKWWIQINYSVKCGAAEKAIDNNRLRHFLVFKISLGLAKYTFIPFHLQVQRGHIFWTFLRSAWFSSLDINLVSIPCGNLVTGHTSNWTAVHFELFSFMKSINLLFIPFSCASSSAKSFSSKTSINYITFLYFSELPVSRH